MSVVRQKSNDLHYLIYGDDYLRFVWSDVWAQGGYYNTHISVSSRPDTDPGKAGWVDMSLESDSAIQTVTTREYEYNTSGNLVAVDTDTVSDLRTADRLTLDNRGIGVETPFVLAMNDVEYVDAPLEQETHLRIISRDGFTTDGSLTSISSHIGHQTFVFTNSKVDSTLQTGNGFDRVHLVDDPDLPGQQYWALVRRDGGQLDAYNLLTGHRVRLEGDYKGWGADDTSIINYGAVEEVYISNFRDGGVDVYNPGRPLDDQGQDERGNFANIDLRSDGEIGSDSFNLAYFNFIRYTTDNVWVGEATIHDGTNAYLIGDQRITDAVSYDLIGTSRNGTHDLIISELSSGVAGNLRVYSNDVSSEMYNTFNDVYVGDGGNDSANYSGNGSDWSDRVALYGFGGNDILTGGAGSM